MGRPPGPCPTCLSCCNFSYNARRAHHRAGWRPHRCPASGRPPPIAWRSRLRPQHSGRRGSCHKPYPCRQGGRSLSGSQYVASDTAADKVPRCTQPLQMRGASLIVLDHHCREQHTTACIHFHIQSVALQQALRCSRLPTFSYRNVPGKASQSDSESCRAHC